MARALSGAGFTLLLFLAGALALGAQDTRSGPTSSPTSDKNTQTLTGCLRAGDHNLFKLDAQDGRIWEVRSDKVKLASQVGHTVTLTGTALAAETNEGHNRLAVSKLIVVSNGCQSDIPMQQ